MFSIPEFLRSDPKFTNEETRALYYLSQQDALGYDNAADLTRFLGVNIGNKDLNHRLSRALKRNQKINHVSRKAMKTLAQYTFKSQKLAEKKALTERAAKNLTSALLDRDIQSPVSLRELRGVESMAKFHQLCEDLRELGVEPGGRASESLRELFETAETAHVWKHLFVNKMDARMPSSSRDIIGYSFKYYEEYRGIKIPWIAKWWCTKVLGYPVNHLAIGYRNHGLNQNHESHMWGEEDPQNRSVHLMQRKSHLGNYINPTFRVNVEHMINRDYQGRIVGAYNDVEAYQGMSWQEIVKEEYELVARAWHNGARFDGTLGRLRNPSLKRMLVALAVNTLGLFSRPWRERARFEDDLFRYGTEVSCSEFGLKASLQTMDLLGQRLAAKLNLPEDEREAIITPPFDETRRFQRYSPSAIIARGIELGIFEGNAPVEVPQFYRSQVAY